jgi:hypothetical protein
MSELGRTLVLLGGALLAVGALLWIGGRLGIGRLPGDLDFRVGNARVVFPIVTCIVLSILLTLVLNFLGRR